MTSNLVVPPLIFIQINQIISIIAKLGPYFKLLNPSPHAVLNGG